ncbi:flavin reductase family protein [Actinoplanes sp. NPDC051494]|uniref:flavin reductase family protein n=1 Tax=Actinoplanes sp. NPDC051494 TaxID=3363907 RepID=UPI00378A54B7
MTHDKLSTAPSAAADLRAAFRRHAAGVAIITATGGPGPVGFTASSVASVSTDPPLLSFNVSRTASCWPALSRSAHVGVHVLGRDQIDLAALFAQPGADRFGPGTAWHHGPYGVPQLPGCAAFLVAAVHRRIEAGDHVVVLARVLHGTSAGDAPDPLIRHDGRYLSGLHDPAHSPRGMG